MEQSKREVLRDKVVELVKEFIKNEGGISQDDLSKLFGHSLIGIVFNSLPIVFETPES